ncbi:hypothetical protein G7Y89_g15592 [Cudoniella acicularis]|uniref:Uncharacterized protein n=1 Tax=Cudoniella acicularis TaxID=354080 RepID=A0A8H4QKD5_9HELO|nr:hypothetical protein G7Y89_g15592 [Cudoniella acicularis]
MYINDSFVSSSNEVQIFCHDKPDATPDNPTSCASHSGHIKVERYGGTDNAQATIFCSSWFSLGTLDAIFKGASTGPDKYDISKYDNRALHWVGAMMQLPSINTFNAKLVKYQKLDFPTPIPNVFARSYIRGLEKAKYLGNSTCVQDKLGGYPHKPQVPSSLPSMQNGFVVLADETANGDLPDDLDLDTLQASLD